MGVQAPGRASADLNPTEPRVADGIDCSRQYVRLRAELAGERLPDVVPEEQSAMADAVLALEMGLRAALAAIDAHDRHSGVCDDNVMADADLAELRKLFGPEADAAAGRTMGDVLRSIARITSAKLPSLDEPRDPALAVIFCTGCGLECHTCEFQAFGQPARLVSSCCAKDFTTTPTGGPYR